IEDVRYAILDTEIRPEDDPFHANLRLVVVDSASAVLSTLLTATQSQGHALMTTFARSLRSLATAHHIAILSHLIPTSTSPGRHLLRLLHAVLPALGLRRHQYQARSWSLMDVPDGRAAVSEQADGEG
ncbi:hypothetical protein BC938DRAFT_472168, partial [Jimgerdemannia flammicorona]